MMKWWKWKVRFAIKTWKHDSLWEAGYPLETPKPEKRRTRRLGNHKVSILPIYLSFWPFLTVFENVTFFTFLLLIFHFFDFFTFCIFCFCHFLHFIDFVIFDDFDVFVIFVDFTFFYYFSWFFNFVKGILKIRPSFDHFYPPSSTPMASTLGGSIPYVKFDHFFLTVFWHFNSFLVIFTHFWSIFRFCH